MLDQQRVKKISGVVVVSSGLKIDKSEEIKCTDY